MEDSNNQLNLLSPLLTKNDCASCKFCCSFRRQSLWETPVFDSDTMKNLHQLYPTAKFRPTGKTGSSWTIDLSGDYKTNDPKEEAKCPFLNSQNGCSLSASLKPFDCKIWPLRAVRYPQTNTLEVALTSTCPAINKIPLQKISELVKSGLGRKILSYARQHPDIEKEYRADLFLSL